MRRDVKSNVPKSLYYVATEDGGMGWGVCYNLKWTLASVDS